jgi:orotate phosphoribosyltransferase
VNTVDLAYQVRVRCRLTGRFVLGSGRVADEYFDKYQFAADPVLLDALAAGMALRVPEGTEVPGGLELGGGHGAGTHIGLPCMSGAGP